MLILAAVRLSRKSPASKQKHITEKLTARSRNNDNVCPQALNIDLYAQ